MGEFGIVLLIAAGVAAVLTGLPVFAVLIGAALVGAVAAWAAGLASLSLFAVLPVRVLALLENDLLQALPLYVLMGVLLDRMRITPSLFEALSSVGGGRQRPPLAATILVGAIMGPMNGSVSASVLALGRSAGPILARCGTPDAVRLATVAAGGTLGVVVPPSLVLILLGDAMMSAHTIAVNATGRMDRIINTQDVFRAALPPAALFICLALVIAALMSRGPGSEEASSTSRHRSWRTYALAATTMLALAALLAGVAAGYLYAVEAAATGAVALLVLGIVTRRLDLASLDGLLADALRTSGALFAPLVAATTFTLVLRTLGTDKLVAAWLQALPGGEALAVGVVLAVIAASAFVLDAFEIIFVIVPLAVPPLLMRVPDAAWVSTLVLLTLQASFLLPPVGYALLVARNVLGIAVPARTLTVALLPFLAAQASVLLLVLAQPRVVHLLSDRPAGQQRPTPSGNGKPPAEVSVPPPESAPADLLRTPPSFN